MRYFCTYFDSNYLLQGLALYSSLRQSCDSFVLWILCLDHDCYNALSKLGLAKVQLIKLEEIENHDDELKLARQNRSQIEYYFTTTPALILFIQKNYPSIDILTYLDADVYFFSDLSPIYNEIDTHSIAIIEHRFPEYLRRNEKFGKYNVGFLSFRNDSNAYDCLRWWRERCIEWCYDRCEGGRFADQKYLDDWPDRFMGVVVLRHKGANLALWNLANYKLTTDGKNTWVDEEPLIFFHFHGFREVKPWIYSLGVADYKVRRSTILLHRIYAPYIRKLHDIRQQAQNDSLWKMIPTNIRFQIMKKRRHNHATVIERIKRKLVYVAQLLKRIYGRQYIIFLFGRIV